MDKDQSAVQWLIEQLAENGILHSSDIYKAKEMEKEQIIKARQDIFHTGNLSAEEYYNETYGSMITDIPITNKDKEELNEILNKVQRKTTFKSE